MKPDQERHYAISAIVLAAGNSTRFGPDNKLSASISSRTILTQSCEVLLQSSIDDIIVVLGIDVDHASVLPSDLRSVINNNPSEGIASSIIAGVKACPENCDGIMIYLADMPFIHPDTIDKLITAFHRSNGEKIIIPQFFNQRGHPVIFPINFKSKLMQLTGDTGARKIIEAHKKDCAFVTVNDEGVIRDIDTQEELKNSLRGI